jgi:hypothetical protein
VGAPGDYYAHMSTPDFRSALDNDAFGRLPPPAPPKLPPPPPTPREWFALAELVAEAQHQMSHALHQIAGDLAAIRAKVEALAPIAEGFNRGGKLGAWQASRAARKDGGNPQ